MNVSGTGQPRAAAYEAFYGLALPPFTLSADPRFLYLSASHDAAIRQILQAIRRKEAFTVLTGEIGTGKTTICRALVERFDRTIARSLILNPFLTIDELLRTLLADFGVAPPDEVERERLTRATTHALTTAVCEFLERDAPSGGSAVLIVDEAQLVSPRVLDELRGIAGLGEAGSTPLLIVLVGQPDLLDVLASADLRQLDKGISLRVHLEPLDLDDVSPYIAHRLAVAGESVSVVFERSAVTRVHTLTGGVPRAINLLCDRALAAGAERGVHEITRGIVDQAADVLAFKSRPATPGRRRWLSALGSWLSLLRR